MICLLSLMKNNVFFIRCERRKDDKRNNENKNQMNLFDVIQGKMNKR